MNDDNQIFVEYDKYCQQCVFSDLSENKEPCDYCLTYPATETGVPLMFKERK